MHVDVDVLKYGKNPSVFYNTQLRGDGQMVRKQIFLNTEKKISVLEMPGYVLTRSNYKTNPFSH